jgi:hypothetical protein
MTTPNGPPPPAWVRKRDGRLVPFDADRISRSLFAAGESVGQPDPFLARELADVAVHFLADESEGVVPTTEQVREVVVKVLRELKQHVLATAFDSHSRTENGHAPAPFRPRIAEEVFRFSLADSSAAVRDGCLKRYTLHAVFTRDLVAAHQEGVISLSGLLCPETLEAGVVGPLRRIEDLLPRLEETSTLAGQLLALEGLEHVLAQALPSGSRRVSRQRVDQTARRCADVLMLGLRLTGRRAVVNLNAPPPAWADEVTDGPLFAGQPRGRDAERLELLAESLAEALVLCGEQVRLDWHLSERDVGADEGERLTRLARLVLQGAPLAFVFDRPRQPIALAEGLRRGQPAVLLSVGVNLPRLARLVIEEPSEGASEEQAKGVSRRAERFLDKLGSLARLALSAALQKREFLRLQARRHPALTSGFLLERARLLVAPLGLDDAVQALLGQGLCAADESLQLGRAILTRLREVLRNEGRASTLETCLDATESLTSGPTCWAPQAAVKAQLRAVGALHGAAGGGSGVVFLPHEATPTAEQLTGWLRWAWDHTDIERLRLERVQPPLKQLTFSDA